MVPWAVARIRGSYAAPGLEGKVTFRQDVRGVWVDVSLRGLPENGSGFFALHIHEGRSCEGEGAPGTGGHYDPMGREHPRHAGDLPSLLSCGGEARMRVFTDRFRVEEIMGRAVVIHAEPDDFRSRPAGNAGKKIGCGVIGNRVRNA